MKSPLKGTKFATGLLSSCLAALVVGAGAIVFAPAQAGAAPITTFTWSGAGTPTASGLNWSNGANWVGGVAPNPTNGAVNLDFPTSCGPSNDDILGLLANNISFEAACALTAAPNASLTMQGNLDVASGITAGVQIAVPLVLTAASTWTLDSSLALNNPGQLGGRFPLSVVLADASTFTVDGAIDVGQIAVSGATPADTGVNAPENGTVFLDGSATADLNGASGVSVSVTNAGLSGVGMVGPLTTSGAYLTIGAANGAAGTLDAVIPGPTVLDAASVLGFPLSTPGSPTANLTVGGGLTLNSARLSILDSCPEALGKVFTLISSPQGLTGQLSDINGNPIADGTIIGPATGSHGCAPGSPESFYRINYTATTVTATAVATQTLTNLVTSNASPALGQAYTLTATVTETAPAAGNPIGTVSFADQNGPLCTSVPVSGSPSTATCTVTPVVTGVVAIVATFTPSASDPTDTGSTSNTVDVNVVTGPLPVMKASPAAVSFGTQRAGLIGPSTTVTLTNQGPGNEILNNLSFVGADPNDFVGQSNCGTASSPAVLAPGQSCQVQVSFAATITGPRSASLILTDNEATPLQVPLNGIGTVGYYEATTNGSVLNFGDAQFYGDLTSIGLRQPIVGMSTTPDGNGYWLVARDGGVFSFGDANFYGSTGSIVLNKPIVGMATTPDGGGYWLVASDGGVFSFGDANFWGSTGAIHLNKPIVGMATTPDGGGYWLVASDGGIFSFGDANFFGSTGALKLNKPIVGMASTPDGGGYWLVASDGGIFAFGDANYFGSIAPFFINNPVMGMVATPDGGGYWLLSTDGGIFAFGDATYLGGAAGTGRNNVVALAGTAPPAFGYLGVAFSSAVRSVAHQRFHDIAHH